VGKIILASTSSCCVEGSDLFRCCCTYLVIFVELLTWDWCRGVSFYECQLPLVLYILLYMYALWICCTYICTFYVSIIDCLQCMSCFWVFQCCSFYSFVLLPLFRFDCQHNMTESKNPVMQDTIHSWNVDNTWYCKLVMNSVPSVLWHCWLGGKKGIWLVKTESWGTGVVVCLERGANDLHMVQLMPLPPHHLLLQ